MEAQKDKIQNSFLKQGGIDHRHKRQRSSRYPYYRISCVHHKPGAGVCQRTVKLGFHSGCVQLLIIFFKLFQRLFFMAVGFYCPDPGNLFLSVSVHGAQGIGLDSKIFLGSIIWLMYSRKRGCFPALSGTISDTAGLTLQRKN